MSMENCVATPGSYDSTDRISELPQPLLHHILRLLSQKEAVKTRVLSKSWRYLGSTRPNLEFVFCDRDYNEQTFMSVVENTLLRWFSYLVATMGGGGVKTFDLSVGGPYHPDLHSKFFENSKSLRFLRLCGFRFSQNLPMDKIHLEHLQTLILWDADIVDETFQNILSSCPFIERLDLLRCMGLTTIRLMNKKHLKRFYLYHFNFDYPYIGTEDLCLVDVPNLESLEFSTCCHYWFNIDRRRNMYFPGLKSLKLSLLRLPMRPSLDILSCDFPCLQDLSIQNSGGFRELQVSNLSIKKMTLLSLSGPMKIVVDAPNLELLNYKCSSTFDFSSATTSEECISKMAPRCNVHSEDGFLELRKLLEVVSQSSSKIHLLIPHMRTHDDSRDYGYGTTSDEDDDNNGVCTVDYYGDEGDNNGGDGYDGFFGEEGGGGYDFDDYFGDEGDDNNGDGGNNVKPVAVEYLLLDEEGHEYFYSEKFLNRMFRYCRRRNIMERHCTPRTRSRFLCKKLVLKQKKGSPCHWKRDLEEASMVLKSGAAGAGSIHDDKKNHEVWFKLKWREQVQQNTS